MTGRAAFKCKTRGTGDKYPQVYSISVYIYARNLLEHRDEAY